MRAARTALVATLLVAGLTCLSGVVDAAVPPRDLVVDVSGHPDDFLALAALLKLDTSANARVRIVTVHGNYAASLQQAVSNALEFVTMFGAGGDVQVAAGASQSWTDLPERRDANSSNVAGSTSATITHRTEKALPTCTRRQGVAPQVGIADSNSFEKPVNFGADTYTRQDMDDLFGVADALPVTEGTPVADALRAVTELLRTTTIDVEYIALGSLTNLAEVLRAAPTSSLRRLRAIHIGGGNDLERGDLAQWMSPEGLAGTDLRGTSLHSTTTWAFFVDPVAASFATSFALPMGCARYVYTRDVIQTVRARYSQGVGQLSREFGALTTGAMARAATLRKSSLRSASSQATQLEFVAALLEAQRLYVQTNAATNSAFDRQYYKPCGAFVALSAVHPTVRRDVLPSPRDKRVEVDSDGVMLTREPGTLVSADESQVYVSAVTSRGTDVFFDTLLATLGLA